MKTKGNIIIIIILLASIITIASCRHGRHSKAYHGCPDSMIETISTDLDLNDAQKGKLIEFKDELVSKKDKMRTGHLELKEALVAELKSDSFNEDRIKTLLDREQALLDEVTDLFVDRLGEFHSVLTPEQRVMLAAKVEKMKRHKQGWKRCYK